MSNLRRIMLYTIGHALTIVSRYALRALAARMSMTELDDQCLSKLASDTEDAIQRALSQGLTLRQVLGLGDELEEDRQAVSNIVQVVFQHVLKDKTSPKRLATLVVKTLAEHLDLGLWAQLETMVNPAMSLRLIKAMLARRQVKDEESRDPSVKSESVSTGDESTLFALNGQT